MSRTLAALVFVSALVGCAEQTEREGSDAASTVREVVLDDLDCDDLDTTEADGSVYRGWTLPDGAIPQGVLVCNAETATCDPGTWRFTPAEARLTLRSECPTGGTLHVSFIAP